MLTLALGLFALIPPALAEELPSASELLSAMDRNLQYETRSATLTMQVIDSRRTREYKMISFGRGLEESAMEYQAPEREKGTKMLKKGDNLWLYLPRSERVQKISGHMLRQGMMGSDISYEDMLDSADFEDRYEAVVTGEEELEGRACWKIEATARDETVTYPKAIIWIDKEWLIPSRQELFALSGMQLKTWLMSDVREIEGRQTPTRYEIRDELKEGSKTVLQMEEISFGIELEEEVFTMRWLERK